MPVQLTIEADAPYDESVLWRLHDAYFATCGAAAWTGGEIPHFATSNYAIARQHAALLLALVRELEAKGGLGPSDEVVLLEVGSGLGAFAANFLEALERGSGAAGRALLPRVRYVLSDYAERSVREAISRPPLREHAAAGRVVPALLDIRAPEALAGLDGAPLPALPAAVFANYVCCATPVKVFRKTREGFFEKRVRVGMLLPDEAAAGAAAAERILRDRLGAPTRPGLMPSFQVGIEWRPVDLGAALGDPVHESAVRDATAAFEEATVAYPRAFFDFLRRIGARLRPGGLALVTDYGSAGAAELKGLQDRHPTFYGNTLAHEVNFTLLEAFCARAGLALVRTRGALRTLQTAAIRYRPDIPDAFRAAFRRSHVRRTDGQDLLDFRAGALAHVRCGEYAAAARLFARALRLDPSSAEIAYHLGEACFEAGLYSHALRHLRAGMKLDREHRYDFAFQLGRVYARLGRLDAARRAYERALEREDDPMTHANLGFVCERQGDAAAARAAFRTSLEKGAEGPLAEALVKRLSGELERPPQTGGPSPLGA
jgi:tetratricopeptide (TPR) repeat protein